MNVDIINKETRRTIWVTTLRTISALYAFNGTGSTIGIAISSVVFQNMLDKQLWALLGDLPGGAEVISQVKATSKSSKFAA